MAPFPPPVLLTDEEKKSLCLSLWGRRRSWPLWGMSRVHSPDFASFVIFVQPSSQVSLRWPHGLSSQVSHRKTTWTAACQDSTALTASWSLESVMLANHLILLPPSPPALTLSQHQSHFWWAGFQIRWPEYWASASASVLPVSIQGWFPLWLTGLISLLSLGGPKLYTAKEKKRRSCNLQEI